MLLCCLALKGILSAAGLDPGQRDAVRLGKSDEEISLIIPIDLQTYRFSLKSRHIQNSEFVGLLEEQKVPVGSSENQGRDSLAISPVQPVWCEDPTPRPLSPWKYLASVSWEEPVLRSRGHS